MERVLYSHRLKALLQQTVVENGLTMTLSDSAAEVSLASHERMISEVAQSIHVKVEVIKQGNSTSVVFTRK